MVAHGRFNASSVAPFLATEQLSATHLRKPCGTIWLTLTAKSALHLGGRRRTPHAVEQLDELEQVRDPQRAAPGSHRDERVRVRGVGEAARQRALDAVIVEEEHSVLPPRLTSRNEHELPSHPRVEGMRHTDSSLLTNGIGRS